MEKTKTRELISRRTRAVARGVGMFTGEISAAAGHGALLTDADGNEFIDLASGIGVTNVGHCDPRVVAAITAQASRLLHTCIHVATYEPYVALCEKLVEILPHHATEGEGGTKVMLANSGAEAVENAIKIARQATGRGAVLCFEGGFHGRTLLGMSLTAKSAYKRNCGPFAAEIYRLPFPHYFKDGGEQRLDDYVARSLARIEERFILGPVPAEHVAALIIEPVQGEGGFIPAPAGFLRGLRELCTRHGIVMICDEVQSGFGRTGAWAAYEHAGVVPDISTWAKAMGGGLPISAVIGRAEVMDAAAPGTIGGTYGGNPLACAAALATIEVIEREGLLERAKVLGERVRSRLDSLRERCPIVADVRGLGAMLAMELCHGGDPLRPATQATARAAHAIREAGVLILTAGPHGNVLRLLPPLMIADSHLDRALDVIDSAILNVARQEAA